VSDPKKWLTQRMSAATQEWRTTHEFATKSEARKAIAGERWPTRVILRVEWEAERAARGGR
jgi:hypothetical protein